MKVQLQTAVEHDGALQNEGTVLDLTEPQAEALIAIGAAVPYVKFKKIDAKFEAVGE